MQEELQRTSEEFTSGIVNVPQNTPARLLFISNDDKELFKVGAYLKESNFDYSTTMKRKYRKTITEELLSIEEQRHAFSIFPDMRREKRLKRITPYAYLFFELDNIAMEQLVYVLAVYAQYDLPVFYHRTMRGWHFFSIKPMLKEYWEKAMIQLKPLNMACPHITLRVVPNKWINEAEAWKVASFQWPKDEYGYDRKHTDTLQFAKAVLGQDLVFLKKHYLLVHYRQNGEAGNL